MNNIKFENINIECKNSETNKLKIYFVTNATATHLYKGEACPNSEYVLNIKFNNKSLVILIF